MTKKYEATFLGYMEANNSENISVYIFAFEVINGCNNQVLFFTEYEQTECFDIINDEGLLTFSRDLAIASNSKTINLPELKGLKCRVQISNGEIYRVFPKNNDQKGGQNAK